MTKKPLGDTTIQNFFLSCIELKFSIMSAGWAAAAQAIGQVGGSIASGIIGARGAKKQFKYQQQLQNEAFNYNTQMWNAQNEYNTPEAQMERYREAGLNPRLIYGNGASSSGNATTPPQYQPPEAPNPHQSFNQASVVFMDAISNLLQRQEQIKSQRLDNAMKAVDLENYLDREESVYSGIGDDGWPTMDIVKRPGLGSLKRSQALETLRSTQRQNELKELDWYYNQTRNRRQEEIIDSALGLQRSQREDYKSRQAQRQLQNMLLKMEYQWFNSSKLIKNIAPFLRLLNRR